MDRHRTPTALPALADHILIGPNSDPMALQGVAQAGIPRRLIRLRRDREAVQLTVIRSCPGIGVMQAGIARRDPDLRPVLPRAVAFTLDCWLVLHADLRQNARERRLADHLPSALAG